MCPLRVGLGQGCPCLTTIQQHDASFSECSQASEGNKRHTYWKVRIKLSLFIDDLIVCVGIPEKSITKEDQIQQSPKTLLG